MRFSTKLRSLISLFSDAVRGVDNDLTKGNIDRAIFILSVPMILEMLMESLFAVVDVFYVSRLGDNDAVATVGLTESVLTLVYSIAIGLSMAATAMVARRVGEKDSAAASKAALQSIYLGLGLSFIISVAGFFFHRDILVLLGAPTALIEKCSGYTKWMFTGNATVMLLFIINASFRGAGNATLAMRSLWIANGLNLLLDPIFIFGIGPFEGWGIEGAAIATNIGRGIGVLYQVYHLLKGSGVIRIQRANSAVDWSVIRRLLTLAAGGTGQFVIASASWIFLMGIISTFGSPALAGYTIAIRIIVFTILPSWGMANAAATLVGQNLGASMPDRAEKSVWRAAFVNMIFLGSVSIVFLLFAEPLIRIFTNDMEVITHGMWCLRIVSLGYMFYAYGMVVGQSFNGAGDTRTPTLLNLLGFWMIQIPLAYWLAINMNYGSSGVFVAISIAESILALASIYVFRLGRWKLVQV